MHDQKVVKPLDCTLRDGSYVIDFKFTSEETSALVSELSKAGVPLVEVGHGLGLGAQEKHGKAAASDMDYVRAATRGRTGSTQTGCFFIPGIGNEDALKEAYDEGLSFIRIGANATEIESALPYIELAKKTGLDVYSNLMKSYVLSPYQICMAAKKAESAGANGIFLVDSAGGMFPNEVAKYIRAISETVSIHIGFHGHNNLGLANACSLAALENGASIIDSTLQGMGRDTGNAVTESMLMIYEKLGYKTGADVFKVMEAGEKHIRPKLKASGYSGIQVTSGFARFHSSFLKHVNRASEKFLVDPRKLIIEVSKIDNNQPTPELFEEVASALTEENSRVRYPKVLSERKSRDPS